MAWKISSEKLILEVIIYISENLFLEVYFGNVILF